MDLCVEELKAKVRPRLTHIYQIVIFFFVLRFLSNKTKNRFLCALWFYYLLCGHRFIFHFFYSFSNIEMPNKGEKTASVNQYECERIWCFFLFTKNNKWCRQYENSCIEKLFEKINIEVYSKWLSAVDLPEFHRKNSEKVSHIIYPIKAFFFLPPKKSI